MNIFHAALALLLGSTPAIQAQREGTSLERELAPPALALARSLDGGLAVPTQAGFLLTGRGYRAELGSEGLHYEPVVLDGAMAGARTPYLELALRSLVLTGGALELEPAGPPVRPGGVYGDALVTPYLGADLVQLVSARPDGVELEIWLEQRPTEGGAARLEFALEGDLSLLSLETFNGEFDAHTLGRSGAVTIGRALAIDATGAVTELHSRLEGGSYTIELSAELLARASFPLRVDPLIGPQTPLSGLSSAENSSPDVVFDPVGGDYIVVWQRPTSGTNSDIWAVRVDTFGLPIGTPFTIDATAAVLSEAPSLAVDPNTGNYLVAYEHHPSGGTRTTAWSLFDQANTLVASNVVPAVGFLSEGDPDVGFVDGPVGQSGFVLVNRRDGTTAPDASIQVTWIDAATGAALDSQTVAAGTPPRDGEPAVPQFTSGASSAVAFQRFDTAIFDVDVFSACIDLQGGPALALGAPLNVSNDTSGPDGNPDVVATGGGPYRVVWEHVLPAAADVDIQGREVLADCSATAGATLDITSLSLIEVDAAVVQGLYGGPCDGQVLTLFSAEPASPPTASVLGVRWDSAAGALGLQEIVAFGTTGVVTYSSPRAALDGTSSGYPRFLVVYDDDDGSGAPPGEVYGQVVTFDAIPISVAVAPVAPVDCVGGTRTLTSTVTGSGALSYQWLKDGLALPGATSPDLTLSAITAGDAGDYQLEVTGTCAVTPLLSNAATLTVEEPPTAVTIIGPNGDCAGNTIVLTSSVTGGSGTFTYQWLRDGNLIPGATATSLTITNLSAAQTGNYTVAVQNTCGVVSSPDHPVGLTEPPAGASLAAGASTVCVGSGVSFTASVATGSGPFTYEYFQDGVSLGPAGASDVLTLSSVAVADGGDYTVVVSDPCGSTTSPAEALVVDEPITGVTITAASSSVCVGDDVTLVAATASGAPQDYDWFKDGAFVSSTTAGTLALSNVQFLDTGAYTVTPSNSCGSATSGAALDLEVSGPITSVSVTGPDSVCEGAPAVFTASAVGGTLATTTYQWYQDGTPIPGETADTLSIAAAQLSSAGDYTAEAINPCGPVASANAVSLEIELPPVSAAVSGPTEGCEGDPLTLDSVVARGTAPLSYQWFKDGAPIPGANGATLTLASLSAADAGDYSLDAGNACGSVSSPAHTLTVEELPTAVTVSGVSDDCAGATVVLSSSITRGSGTFTYQWLLDGNLIPGATSSTLTIASLSAAEAGNYRVAVQNTCGVVSSPNHPLDVNEPPAGLSLSASASTACVGSSVSFTAAAATGMGPFTYEFFFDGVSLGPAGASDVLTLSSVALADDGDYTVVVSNACGSATSPIEGLVVDEPIAGVTVGAASSSVCVGDDVALVASTTAGAPQAYGWFKDGSFLVSTAANTLQLSNVQFSDIGAYTVAASNACGNVTSPAPLNLQVSGPITSVSASGPGQVCEGAPAVFTASAVGGTLATTTYQWFKDSAPISGATADTLSLGAAQLGDAGAYSVQAANPCGAVTSANAVDLQVLVAPVSAMVSGPSEGCEGGSLTLNAVVSGGSAAPIYQWYKGGTPIPGANGPTLPFVSLAAADAGSYRVDAGNLCGSVSSPDFVLSVNQGPSSVAISGPLFVCPGSSWTLVATPQGGNLTPSYQWLFNGVPIAGATTNTYSVTSLQVSDAGSYTVQVDTTCNSIASQPANLTVLEPPSGVSINASSNTTCVGDIVTMSANVAASTTQPVSFQWLRNGVPIAGETGMLLVLDPVGALDAGDYEVDVTNVCATVRSAPQALLLLDMPLASALDVDDSSVTFSWPWAPNACGNISRFDVLRATAAGGPYVPVGSVPTMTGLGCYTFVDDGTALPTEPAPSAGVTYYYVVQAVDQMTSATITSLEVSATPTAAAAAGDVTGDGTIDGRDLLAVAAAMDACQGQPGWIPSANTAKTSTCAPSSVCGLLGDPEQVDSDDADVVLNAFGSVLAVP